MQTKLRWSTPDAPAYLYRTPDGLRCGTRADVPDCECCDGVPLPPGIPQPCPSCRLHPGLAWNWQVTPENWVGGLITTTEAAQAETMGCWPPGRWDIADDSVALPYEDGRILRWYTPLLPPADVAPLAELLGLLPNTYMREGCRVIELGGGLLAWWADYFKTLSIGHDPKLAGMNLVDPDKIILAANRHKALVQWAGGAG